MKELILLFPLVAPSLVFTKNIPTIDAKAPRTLTKTGANTAAAVICCYFDLER